MATKATTTTIAIKILNFNQAKYCQQNVGRVKNTHLIIIFFFFITITFATITT
jgi:hypothetical protein